VPYQFNFKVPTGISSLTIGATAVDFGGNIGAATNVVVNVIPDPLTTAVGASWTVQERLWRAPL